MKDWIVTDPSCNRQMRQLGEGVFEFKEQRILHPDTKETQEHSQVIDLKDYTLLEMMNAVLPFGYSIGDISEWLGNDNMALIAECIFETTTD